jgi:hypothetical protein
LENNVALQLDLPNDRVADFVAFILARHDLYKRKRAEPELGPADWTDDPILRQYRFCNVYRELDTVTKWIATNWREPWADDKDLWFAMTVARWVNWPDTLAELGYPGSFDARYRKRFIDVLKSRAARGEKVWTGAYMIGTQGNAVDKPVFIADHVLAPVWRMRDKLRPVAGDTLASFAHRMIAVKNHGKFMVGQVVADTKYAQCSPLALAADWSTWAISGPGSRRGLSRIVGRELTASWPDGLWLDTLQTLHVRVKRAVQGARMPAIHAQDVQNCLCEFDKYERVRLGEGKPRSRYTPAR